MMVRGANVPDYLKLGRFPTHWDLSDFEFKHGCFFSSYCESRARYNLTEPNPSPFEYVAVQFILEPFRLSGSCLRTMKISVQGCHVDTSYFIHNRKARGGRKRLIPSCTGPVCETLLQIVVRAVITPAPPAWTSSAGMLSTQADFPFFNDCTAASTSL